MNQSNLVRIVVLCLFVTIQSKSFAQMFVDSTQQSTFYFSETPRVKQQLFKTDLAGIYYGDISFFYEFERTKDFNLEIGVGLLTAALFDPIQYHYSMINNRIDTPREEKPSLGYTLSCESKLYRGIGSYSTYGAIPIRIYHYIKEGLYFESGYKIGRQWLIKNRFVLDLSSGLHVGIESNKPPQVRYQPYAIRSTDNLEICLYLKLGLKVGFN